MTQNNMYNNIPAEKFRFAKRSDLGHDSKFDTKPVSYFQGAFRRFCKNKGAIFGGIVITFLVLFAIIAPYFTPYQPKDYDMVYAHVTPKLDLLAKTGVDFWDGYKMKNEVGYLDYIMDYAVGLETGREVIKRDEVKITNDGSNYTYRYSTYYGVGFGIYRTITLEEYNDIQRYQNETGRQVIYPTVDFKDRPTAEQDKNNANYFFKTEKVKGKTRPVVDENGDLIPLYKYYYEEDPKSGLIPEYNSKRIEGDCETVIVTDRDGNQTEKTKMYAYGILNPGGTVEIRAEYYEYYTYIHTQVKKDGISEPNFVFGSTGTGKDIFACLSYGARFSFIFATVVAVVNFIVGVIWGSIAGYFGGKVDLFMERFTDILGAVPTMIVITLLKYHMGASSHMIALFITFFATGWIGMASTTRMQFYRYKNQEYVLAARTLGAKDWRIMFKHIFPNGLGTIVTSTALVIPAMIYSETSLSYLGIVNLEAGNTTSVGTLIAAAQTSIVANAGYVALFPCLFLVLMMLSFNLFGNGLRDAFNPSLRGSED